MSNQNELPCELAAEKAVLGAILLNPEVYYDVVEVIDYEDFYNIMHQSIFRAMSQVVAAELAIDEISIENELKSSGDNRLKLDGVFALLCEIKDFTPTSKNVLEYTSLVYQTSLRRRSVALGVEFASKVKDKKLEPVDVIDEYAEKINGLIDERSVEDTMISMGSAINRTLDKLEERIKNPNSLLGVSTGFHGLDKKTSGLVPSDLIIVGARPSMGKTTFSMGLCESAMLSEDKPVLVFSLEMPAEQLTEKMMASLGRVELSKIRNANMDDEDWAKVSYAMSLMKEKKDNLYIDDASGLSPAKIRAKARKIHRRHGGLSLIMIDYLQLMKVPSLLDNRTLEIAEISRSLKALAKELNVPVVALSQLNRKLEDRTDKRPVNSDLREGGSIEQDADVIMFLYRDEVYNENSEYKGIAEVIIGKQRNGPIGKVLLNSYLEYSRFEDYAGNLEDDRVGE